MPRPIPEKSVTREGPIEVIRLIFDVVYWVRKRPGKPNQEHRVLFTVPAHFAFAPSLVCDLNVSREVWYLNESKEQEREVNSVLYTQASKDQCLSFIW